MKDMYFHVHTHILCCNKQIRKKEKRFGSIQKYSDFRGRIRYRIQTTAGKSRRVQNYCNMHFQVPKHPFYT